MKALVKGFIKIFFCKIFYRVKYINADVLKKYDKCLICPNHSNTLEPTWIYAKTDHVAIMAKAELFQNKFISRWFKRFDVFPIRRGEHDVKSLIHAINLFKNVKKRRLLVFPEGERLKKYEDRIDAKVGPAYIANKVGVPIIPVYITKNAKMFSRVNIIYGEAIYVPDDVRKDKEKLKEFSNHLMDIVYDLPNKYLSKNNMK